MHSIVVYGDCRFHRLFDERGVSPSGGAYQSLLEQSWQGGVFFMLAAIRESLNSLTFSNTHSRPKLFSFDPALNHADPETVGFKGWTGG